jgi:hypothetical protein
VLRVTAFVGEVLRRLVLCSDLDELRLLGVLLTEVNTETALAGLDVLHGNLRCFVRNSRGMRPYNATKMPPAPNRAGIITGRVGRTKGE